MKSFLKLVVIIFYSASATGNSVLQYGAIPGDGLDDTTAFQEAIDRNSYVTIPDPGGAYSLSGTLYLDKTITLEGQGFPALHHTGPGDVLQLGRAEYLQDLQRGYHRITLQNFIVRDMDSQADAIIRNNGVRTIMIDNLRTFGGEYSFVSEGAHAQSSIRHTRFQNARSHGVILNQRNNNFLIESSGLLGSGGNCLLLDTEDFELKGVTVHRTNMEGCRGAMQIKGNTGMVSILGGHFENNDEFTLRIYNRLGEPNKYGTTVQGSYINGAPVLVGVDTEGSLVSGVVISASELVEADIVVISDKTQGFHEYANTYNKGSRLVILEGNSRLREF